MPVGRTDNGGSGDKGAWQGPLPADVGNVWASELQSDYENICLRDPGTKSMNGVNHLGTLGTGNHFIEVSLDQEGIVWGVLHSGSRGPGNRLVNGICAIL